jgi:hypothetical protein
MHLPGGARLMAPQHGVVPPRVFFEIGVDAGQRVVEQLVVITELQELGISELDNLERGLHACVSIVYERRIPRRDDEVVREVGDAVSQHLVPFLPAERRPLASQHRRDDVSVMLHDLISRVRPAQVANRKNEIVLSQRRLTWIGYRVVQALGDRAARLVRLEFECFVLDELIGCVRKVAPCPFERARQTQ